MTEEEIIERTQTFVSRLPEKEHEQRARAFVRAAKEASAAATALRRDARREAARCDGSYREIAKATGMSKTQVWEAKKEAGLL